MNEKYTLEELEAYLFGEMTPEQKKDLEVEIETDTALKEELEALKISREAVEMAGWKALIAKNQQEYLADRNNEKVKPIQTTPKSKGMWLGRIAASLVILFVGTVTVLFFTVSPKSITSNQVSYSIPVLRSAESELGLIEEAYRVKDFERVLALSKELSDYDPTSYLLIGLSYLERQNGAKAEEYLTQIESENLKTSESNYADQVDYYLVNAYIIQDKPADAERRIAKILGDEDHTYHGNFNQLDRLKVKILKIK